MQGPLQPGDQAEGDLPSQGRARRCEAHWVHDRSLSALGSPPNLEARDKAGERRFPGEHRHRSTLTLQSRSLVSLQGDQCLVPSGDRKKGTRLRRPCQEPLSPFLYLLPTPIQRSAQPLPGPKRSKSPTWGLGLGASPESLSPQGLASGAAARAHGPCRSVGPQHSSGQARLALLRGRRTPGPRGPRRCLPGGGEPRGSEARGAGGTGCGAQSPGVRTLSDTKSRAARSLRLLPAPQGPPLGDAARAPPRGGGSANKLGSSSGRALRSLLRAAAPGTVSRAPTRALRD